MYQDAKLEDLHTVRASLESIGIPASVNSGLILYTGLSFGITACIEHARMISQSVQPLTQILQVKPRPHLLHPRLPLPLQRVLALAAGPADALVDAAQLDVEVRPERLQADAHLLEPFNLVALGARDGLLGRALVAEDVAVAPDHDEVALVVHRDDLPALDLGLRRVQRVEGLADQEAEAGAEVVEEQFGLCFWGIG